MVRGGERTLVRFLLFPLFLRIRVRERRFPHRIPRHPNKLAPPLTIPATSTAACSQLLLPVYACAYFVGTINCHRVVLVRDARDCFISTGVLMYREAHGISSCAQINVGRYVSWARMHDSVTYRPQGLQRRRLHLHADSHCANRWWALR